MNLDEKTKSEIGKRLRESREQKKLTQADVAKKAGITSSYYARIERGEINTSYEKLHKIAEVLKIKIF